MQTRHPLSTRTCQALGALGLWIGLWTIPAHGVSPVPDPCADGTCFALDSISPQEKEEIRAQLDRRILTIVRTWYSGKKCDFVSGTGEFDENLTDCAQFIPGAVVGKICNPAVQPDPRVPNPPVSSCGSKCQPAMTCRKTYSYNGVTHSFQLDGNPKEGCQLCRLKLNSARTTPAQWQAFSTKPASQAVGYATSQNFGTIEGSGCDCCTIQPNYSTCNLEGSWIRGYLVHQTLTALDRMKAALAESPARIPTPAGSASRCAPMRDTLQKLRADLLLHSPDPEDNNCSDTSSDLLAQLSLKQGACYREAVIHSINIPAAYLAACRILEDAEEAYVRLQPQIRALTTDLDCSNDTTVSACVDRLDAALLNLLRAGGTR